MLRFVFSFCMEFAFVEAELKPKAKELSIDMTNIVYPQVALRQCYHTGSFPTRSPALFNSNFPLLLDLISIGIPPQI